MTHDCLWHSLQALLRREMGPDQETNIYRLIHKSSMAVRNNGHLQWVDLRRDESEVTERERERGKKERMARDVVR